MNIHAKKRKRTLSLNKGRPRHERLSTEPETTVSTFIVWRLVEIFWGGLEMDKPENLKNKE